MNTVFEGIKLPVELVACGTGCPTNLAPNPGIWGHHGPIDMAPSHTMGENTKTKARWILGGFCIFSKNANWWIGGWILG